MTGASLQVRSSRVDLGSVPVREDEVEDHRLRRVRGRRGQRLRRVGSGVDRVPGAAKASSRARAGSAARRRRRGRAARHTASSTGASTTGSASAKVAPCSGRDSAHTRPPFASAKPRAIARPSPAPAALLGRAAVERLEDPLELGLGQAGALVDDPDDRLLPRGGDAHEHPRAGRRELERVLDEVREHALDLSRVDVDERRLADDLDPLARARARRPRRGRCRRATRAPAPARRSPPRGARGRAGRRRAG